MANIKKTLKSVFLVILSVSLIFGLFGCKEQPGEQTGLVTDGLDKSKIKGKVQVTCAQHVYGAESSQNGIRNWIRAFEDEYKNVDVEASFNIDMTTYAAHIAAKDIGDLYWLSDADVYKYAIQEEALMPLEHYAEALKIDLSEVYSGILELGRLDGRLYFVGMSCGQQSFLYNTAALREFAGQNGIDENGRISNQWTWDDFKAIAQKVTKLDAPNAADKRVMASMKVNWAPYYTPFLSGFGGQWADTVNKKVNMTDEKVIFGLQELFNAMDNDWIYCPDGTIAYGGVHASNFEGINETQNCVFQWNQAYTNLSTKGQTLNDAGIEWDVAPFPLFEYAASPCGTIGFGVFNYTDNVDAAAALCLSLYTENGQRAIHGQSGGDVPLLKSLGEDDFWHLTEPGFENKNYSAFTANYDRYIPSNLSVSVPVEVAGVIENCMNNMFAAWASGGMDMSSALADMETTANLTWEGLLKK